MPRSAARNPQASRCRKARCRTTLRCGCAISRSVSATSPFSTASISKCGAGRFSALSAPRAPASRCCCAPSSGSLNRAPAPSRCSAADFEEAGELRKQLTERHWGILFQQGALFSSLNVRQNVQFPMREYLDLSPRLLDEVAAAKLKMVGLPPDVGSKMPGGIVRRHDQARGACARAGARSGNRLPGRADVRPRSHFGAANSTA